MGKKELRNKIIQARLDLEIEDYLIKSNLIISKLKQHPDFINAKTIGIYVSFRNEVNTQELIQSMFTKKRIVVPKINNKTMSFYEINSFTELKESKFGILEPINEQTKINKEEIDLLIIPMVGYDRQGNRLGYGGGYYDRYLADYQGKTIGLAFSLQEIDKIPKEPFDLPITTIINEK